MFIDGYIHSRAIDTNQIQAHGICSAMEEGFRFGIPPVISFLCPAGEDKAFRAISSAGLLSTHLLNVKRQAARTNDKLNMRNLLAYYS